MTVRHPGIGKQAQQRQFLSLLAEWLERHQGESTERKARHHFRKREFHNGASAYSSEVDAT